MKFKDSELGSLPNEWEVIRFGDAVTTTSGQVDPRVEPYCELPHVGPENIQEGAGRILGPKLAKDLGLISGKYLFGTEDVLYSKIRPYLRKAALPSFEGICSADMYALQPTGRLVREFLFYWLLCESFTRQAVSYQSRTGIPKINRRQLNSTWIPVPRKREQRAIAHVLRTVQRAKEATENVIAATRQLKQSLMRHLFTYGPVPVDQAERVDLKETGDRFVPKHWQLVKFTDFATLQRGKDLPRYAFKKGSVPVIGATSVIGYHNEATVKGPGVTVVRSGSSAGKPLFIDQDFWAHNVVLYVKDFHGNDVKFVYYQLLALKLMRFRAGVAVPTLNRNSLKNLTVAVPPLAEQVEIVRMLNGVEIATASTRHYTAALDQLFKSLLHHRMTGKVRVHDLAEIPPAEVA